jgi:hypothetical protein
MTTDAASNAALTLSLAATSPHSQLPAASPPNAAICLADRRNRLAIAGQAWMFLNARVRRGHEHC